MAVSYKKLWKLLIDRDMKKKDLIKQADITQYTMLRLSRNESVNTEALAKICVALNCGFDYIMEVKNSDKE